MPKGYILPTPITGHDLICVVLKIPDVPEYRAAFRGQLKGLTEWWNWERPEIGKGNIEAADYWRQLLHEHLRFMDCYDLGEEIGDVAKPILCKFINENGTVDYKISYNDGCTWEIIPLCDDSVGEEIPDIITPEEPIDVPGNNVPDPDVDSENAAAQRCNIVDMTFKQFLQAHVTSFINGVLGVSTASAIPNALLMHLDMITEGEPDYFQYYPAWKPLAEKYYPQYATLLEQWEDEDNWTGYGTECIVFDCLPADLKITREVLDCIAAGIEAVDYGIKGLLQEFLVDYVNKLPLKAIRERAFRYANLAVPSECGTCEDPVEPDPIVCDIRQLFDFKNSEDALGFISLTEPATDFSCGDAQFNGNHSFYPAVHMLNAGITVPQNSSSTRALGIWKPFDAYKLCQLNIIIPTSTGRLNSRFSAVWYRDALGTWTCLASRKVAIYTNGNIDLIWSGSVTATGIAVVAASGGGSVTVQKIDMNYGVLEV